MSNDATVGIIIIQFAGSTKGSIEISAGEGGIQRHPGHSSSRYLYRRAVFSLLLLLSHASEGMSSAGRPSGVFRQGDRFRTLLMCRSVRARSAPTRPFAATPVLQ